jgi:uncharacterized LabA/DUF88 family protein
MERLRSALYVDFDNIFSGLFEMERKAAFAFASEVNGWMDRLRHIQLPNDVHRDFLVQRAYLNPNGWIDDALAGNANGRLYLQRFRPDLMRAGFEVIDCPAVTIRQKNAADIRIVIDVMLALEGRARFDEVIIASSDADFTPLLHVLRARDLRIAVLSAGEVSTAYKSVAQLFIGPELLVPMMRGFQDPVDDEDDSFQASVPSDPVKPAGVEESPEPSHSRTRESVVEHVLQMLSASDIPLYLSDIGLSLHRQFRSEIQDSHWFGYTTMVGFLRNTLGANLRSNLYFLWDPARHVPPVDGPMYANGPRLLELPPALERICQTTEMPRLPASIWPRMFKLLSDYAGSHSFSITECTAWVRDAFKSENVPVGRQSISFVVRSALMGGVSLNTQPSPDAARIRQGFTAFIALRSESQGIPLDEPTLQALNSWLDGQESAVDEPE